MNKLAEQLSNDIAIRAAQKLAALNGGMEKRAFTLPPEMKKNMANSAIANALVGGGLGALAGMGGTYVSSKISDYDPSWMDYLSTGLEDGLIAGALSGLAGGITGAGELPKMNVAGMKISSYNMEKDAGIGDFVKRMISSPGYRKYFQTRLGQDIGGAVTGAGAGALVGGLGNAARGLIFDKVDPKDDGFFNRIGKGISDFGTGALYGGLAGGAGGAYKAHSNFSNMGSKSKDAIRAARSSNASDYKKGITNIKNVTRGQFNGGFQSGLWQGMNSVGDSLLFRDPVGNFLSSYNNNPSMNKKWNTPVPQTPAPQTPAPAAS